MLRWLSANWIWVVVVGGMLWMHLGMHRGHGGHGSGSHVRKGAPQERRSSTGHGSHGQDPSQPGTAEAGTAGHRHRGC